MGAQWSAQPLLVLFPPETLGGGAGPRQAQAALEDYPKVSVRTTSLSHPRQLRKETILHVKKSESQSRTQYPKRPVELTLQ